MNARTGKTAMSAAVTDPALLPSPDDAALGNGHAEASGIAFEKMISEAAYYLAERRGFAAGAELEDWLTAEEEIGRKLGAAP